LWNFIKTGNNIDKWQIRHIQNTLDRAARQEKLAEKMQIVGVYVGLFVVLCIYGGFFWLLSKLFYPITLLQAIALSISVFLIARIFTIPTIRFWESKGNNGEV